MLKLVRKVGEPVFVGEWIDPEDPSGTCEVALTIERVGKDLNNLTLYGLAEWRGEDGNTEHDPIVFSSSSPTLELIEGLCIVEVLWIASRIQSPFSRKSHKSLELTDIAVGLGFSADQRIKIVRHDVKDKTEKNRI